LIHEIVSGIVFANKISWLPLLISWANFLGGFLIIIGLFTRIVALTQIPILIGALFFINADKEKIAAGNELIFAIITLLLLIFFLIIGSGPISLDNYFKKNPR
ncbi:MAG TPA: DoxX family membrane protein, partial [Puia sp.]|nr:DoxX family membrane protein [Puia sp.]